MHTPKLSKEHINHEIDAHLSTSALRLFSSGILQMVGRARFALAKLPKKHIKHELDADLSTSGSLRFSSRIFQMVERGGFAHTEATLSSTVFTILPICLHLGCPSSPLVSLKCVAAHRSRTWCYKVMSLVYKPFYSATILKLGSSFLELSIKS